MSARRLAAQQTDRILQSLTEDLGVKYWKCQTEEYFLVLLLPNPASYANSQRFTAPILKNWSNLDVELYVLQRNKSSLLNARVSLLPLKQPGIIRRGVRQRKSSMHKQHVTY